jgi:putative membrane protein
VSGDPRVYMAAERTFLAWIRTGVALMGFGFVVARFGLFLRDLAAPGTVVSPGGTRPSMVLGLALVGLGVAVTLIAAVQHRRYVVAIDEGVFRDAFRSTFALGVAILLALLGCGMVVYLATI